MKIRIALDGPAGSGKSTMAKRLSEDFGLYYIDTGALYRAVGLYMQRRGVAPEDGAAVKAALEGAKISFDFKDRAQHVYIADEDVTGLIRTGEISGLASRFSALPAVRAYLLRLQQDFARDNGVIMDGRDIGTVILPDADVKLYLTADAAARAHRRHLQNLEAGLESDEAEVLAQVVERDERDMNREIAPLRVAPGAVVVDSTALDLEGTYRALYEIIKAKAEDLGL